MSKQRAGEPRADEASASLGCAARLCAAFQDADKATELGVNLSIFFFLFLQQGQIIANFRKPEGMLGLRWNGYVAGAMGDLILASFFCNIGELAQASVNVFGTIAALINMIQMFAYRPPGSPDPVLVPTLPFFMIMAVVVVGLLVISLRFCGKGKEAFAKWKHIMTILGGAVVTFTLNYEVLDDLGVRAKFPILMKCTSSVTAATGFAVLLCMVLLNKTNDTTGPWLATILFMYAPLPQIYENLLHPASAEDFKRSFIYCNTIANGLGLARAIYTRNALWMTGAGWSCFAGVMMSASCVIASARLDDPFMTDVNRGCLISFNVAFLVYAAMLYNFLPRKKQEVEEPRVENSKSTGAEVVSV
jgi:hypothetical protein